MASAGRILMIPKGNWDSTTTYENLDVVTHNAQAWLAKKTSTGVEPSAANAEFWHNLLGKVLTAEDVGALPIKGGTLRENLKVRSGMGEVSNDGGGYTSLSAIDSDNKSRSIMVSHPSYRPDLTNAAYIKEVVNGEQKIYRLYGEHNKLSGSYKGNGNASTRTINIGGIGSILLVWGYGSVMLVTSHGAFGMNYNKTTMTVIKQSEANFTSGVLTLATTNDALNMTDADYSYRVI